jgi:hypothetical protein
MKRPQDLFVYGGAKKAAVHGKCSTSSCVSCISSRTTGGCSSPLEPQPSQSPTNFGSAIASEVHSRFRVSVDSTGCGFEWLVALSCKRLRSYRWRANQLLGLSSVEEAFPGAVTVSPRFDSTRKCDLHRMKSGVWGRSPHRKLARVHESGREASPTNALTRAVRA